jgi:metal-sulfur cluster biosynthetic enzyme
LRSAVITALDLVVDPCSVARGEPLGVVEMGLLTHLSVVPTATGFKVVLQLRLTSPGCLFWSHFEQQARERLLAIEEIKAVDIDWSTDFDWEPDAIRPTQHLTLLTERH